jgi:hypothetical protein
LRGHGVYIYSVRTESVKRQPIGKRETEFKELKGIRTGGSYRVRTPRVNSRLDWVKIML